MEDVLCTYQLEYDPTCPLVCMDESCKQLIDEVRIPIPQKPGQPLRYDDEYIRRGVAELFLFVAPLEGWRRISVTNRRTRKDWALQIRQLVEVDFPEAAKIRLVMDNLNTHSISSLYEAFPAEQARRLAERLEIHYTPKHGSWLNMAEIELSALNTQCLDRRIPDITQLRAAVSCWESDRNNRNSTISWHFTTKDARIKLRKLYPNL